MTVKNLLLNWYSENRRNLPWRSSTDAYTIWLSEIILQQTKVEYGLSYYEKFIKKFPNIESLASASLDEVLKLWQGLGYYSRARNLHETAKRIVIEFKGVFPTDYDKIRELKGIGDYTAAAIASIAFNQPYAALDGNAYRVFSRYYGIATPVDSTEGKKELQELVQSLIDIKHPGEFNQAVMDLGATVCAPKPNCKHCPLSDGCYAYNRSEPKDFPVKIRKVKIRERYFYYIITLTPKGIFMRKRKEKDIWNSLYEFPLISSDMALSMEELKLKEEWNNYFTNLDFKIISISDQIKHKLSHQTLYCRFIVLEFHENIDPFHDFILIEPSNFKKISVPRVIDKYILNNKILKFMR